VRSPHTAISSAVKAYWKLSENSICDDGGNSKRLETKLLLKELKKNNPLIEQSIFNSIHAVCLDTMVGYKTGDEEFDFNKKYEMNKDK